MAGIYEIVPGSLGPTIKFPILVVEERRMSDTSSAGVGTSKVPVIFAFQPTHIEPASGDRLAEWERGMKEHVGLGKVDSLALKAAGGSCLSWCGGQTPEAGNFPDDCDQL